MPLNFKKIFTPTKQETHWLICLGTVFLVFGFAAGSRGQDEVTSPISRATSHQPVTLPPQQSDIAASTSTINRDEEIALTEFTEKDFYWDKETKPWKSIIIKGVNKIHRDNTKCAKLDPKSAYTSMNKGTKSNPVFYVTCEPPGETVFNVFFSKSDVDSGKPMGETPHINQRAARELCQKYAKSVAQNPQTVDFSNFIDYGIKEYPNGRTRVISSFKASNLMGATQKYRVDCLFEAKGLVEGSITDPSAP